VAHSVSYPIGTDVTVAGVRRPEHGRNHSPRISAIADCAKLYHKDTIHFCYFCLFIEVALSFTFTDILCRKRIDVLRKNEHGFMYLTIYNSVTSL